MSTMFDTITFSSLVTFKCMVVCPTCCPVPRYPPMYSCHTLAAFPSEYWSVMPGVAVPRDRMRKVLSTLAEEVIAILDLLLL